MIRALQCPLDEDLSQLARFLRSRGVVHRISEEGGRQVVWTVDEADAQIVQTLYASGVPAIDEPERPLQPETTPWQHSLRHIPLTMAVLLVTAVVAAITRLGSDPTTVVLFTLVPLGADGYLLEQPDMSQWWRLITPIFLHFGVLHLAFNALWYWELGRRIEMRSGSLWLLGLTLLFALVSNVSQWLIGGSVLFGGLSGVLYGVLGYCWLYQWIAPNVHFDLPKGVVILMLVWLVLCLTGLVTLLGFGAIANTAHVSGLLIGCVTGALAGALSRHRGAQ